MSKQHNHVCQTPQYWPQNAKATCRSMPLNNALEPSTYTKHNDDYNDYEEHIHNVNIYEQPDKLYKHLVLT